MASRTESRAKKAIEELLEEYPDITEKGGSIEFLQIDLTDLKNCQAAAREFISRESRLDILSACDTIYKFTNYPNTTPS